MATVTSYSVGSGSAVQIFDGVGNIALKTSSDDVWIGGSGVGKTAATGLLYQTGNPPLHLNVTSPDTVYAIANSGTATVTVYHNR